MRLLSFFKITVFSVSVSAQTVQTHLMMLSTEKQRAKESKSPAIDYTHALELNSETLLCGNKSVQNLQAERVNIFKANDTRYERFGDTLKGVKDSFAPVSLHPAGFKTQVEMEMYFNVVIRNILKEFKEHARLNLWNQKGRLDIEVALDSSDGSGWDYFVSDSVEYYIYHEYEESWQWLFFYYVKHGQILMRREIETKSDASFGYYKESVLAIGDSTEYDIAVDSDAFSVLEFNRVLYHRRSDGRTPSSRLFFEEIEDFILRDLEEIRALIKSQD